MYVIIVDFTIHSEHVSAFREAMIVNAHASLTLEPGCKVFDVCYNPAAGYRVFLYEVYDDKAAFDAHLATAHFKVFNETASSWIADKQVTVLDRAYPNS